MPDLSSASPLEHHGGHPVTNVVTVSPGLDDLVVFEDNHPEDDSDHCRV